VIFVTLIAQFFLITACSNSNWTKLATDPNATQYIDHSLTEKAGTRTTFTTMADHSAPITDSVASKFTYRSVVMVTQYDCAENKSQILRGDYFDGSMGSGSNVKSVSYNEYWVPRNRIAGDIEENFKLACR
jgi:hypothetical protein